MLAPCTTASEAPAAIATSAATAAPPEMPSTYGSASGLRSSACSKAPDKASSPPTANAVNARGSRSSRTTVSTALSPGCHRARHTSPAPSGTLPMNSAAANIAMPAPTSSANVQRSARAFTGVALRFVVAPLCSAMIAPLCSPWSRRSAHKRACTPTKPPRRGVL